MPRVQAIVVRDGKVLLVKHRLRETGEEWWCLPGGGQEAGETPAEGAVRELREECQVEGSVVRQTSYLCYGPDDETHTFLLEIGDQAPSLGHDPEVAPGQTVLADLQWLRLRDLPELDRAFLWAAGLLGVAGFLAEARPWGRRISYPGEVE